ncbi:MAG: protein-L-isoaspartate(D-aspartate) O-methyltransferase [Candidatus Krumholzibacteriota bacterium]|nr:protein-L-isoaspartate(D-aspartate) O-methyltransferase [Candidatus Krumholzibacteriota bacterium]
MRTAHAICGLAVFLAAALPAGGCAGGETDYASLRRRMVETQIARRGVTDSATVRAMLAVPRHRFVPADVRGMSYEDHPLPIGSGQTISQPYIVALMTASLALTDTSRVLEVGTGSGYQAAVLAEIAREVYSIEIVTALAERAGRLLAELGYDNVHVRAGDGYAGWPEAAPFDGVIVTAAAPRVPEPLVKQLRAGGRLVIPVGEGWQELCVYEKEAGGQLRLLSTLPVRFVPMTGKVRK